MEDVASRSFELGVAGRAIPGETRSGDVHVVKATESGVLLAAVDGVGHGSDAASAAETAGAVLRRHASEPVISLVMRCHEALRGSRGVVMSLAALDAARGLLTWLGVGNVQGILLHPSPGADRGEETLLLRSGVVGSQPLPRLRAEVLCFSPGDTLVLATDGVAADFSRELARNLPPQKAAEGVLARDGKASDDALVIVARFAGSRGPDTK